jgi:hypothetical protein
MELVNDGSSSCVSDLVLDEWLADELDARAAAATSAHVAGCARCAERRAERTSDREAFLREVPTWSALAARAGGTRAPVATRPRATRGGKVLAWSAAAAGAIALAAAALLVPRGDHAPQGRRAPRPVRQAR